MQALLLAIALTAATPIEARTLDGRTVAGTLAELDAGKVTLQTADGPVSLDTNQLMTIAPKEKPEPPAAEPGAWIDLIDGSSLVARQYAVVEGRSQISLLDGQAVELPVSSGAAVRLKPQSEVVAEAWSRILEMEIDGDLLVVGKGESIDYLRGILRGVTDQTIQFELDGDVLAVKRSKIHGLRYYRPAGDALPEAVCQITDADGSRFSAGSLSLPGDLRWTTPAGLTVTRPLAAVAKLDFSRGKIVYLSDLKPESVEFTPYFGSIRDLPVLAKFYAPQRDKNLESGPLQLGKQQYGKGLALRSRTRVVYRLPGRFSRLKAVAGIDDAVRPRGHVRLVIHGDDKLLLESTLTGVDPPQPVDLDLTGVRRITILADFGDQMDVADHLDLCQARILK